MKCRNWLLTLNNPGDLDLTQEYLERIHLQMKARYTTGQLEKGEEGTPHIQFFMNFVNPTRPGSFKKFDTRIHYEPVTRTPDIASGYCMKADTRLEGPFEFGVKPVRRNNKVDWKEVLDNAKNGNIDAIPDDIIIKHYGNLKRIQKDHMSFQDAPDLRGIWIYGQSGVGKSQYARAHYPDHYPKLCNKWWDGYQGQTNVIMDDFGKEHKCLGQQLKIWSDRYGCPLEIKGGSMPSAHVNFIVTSQYSIEDIFWEDKPT